MNDAELARLSREYLAAAFTANGQAVQAHFIRIGRLSMAASVPVTVALAAVGAALIGDPPAEPGPARCPDTLDMFMENQTNG